MEQTKSKSTVKTLLAAVLTFVVTLAMVFAILPATTLTAYAAGGTEVTQANVICQQYSYMDAGDYSGGSMYDTPPVEITNITLADAQAFGAAVTCPTTYWVVVYAKDGNNLKWTSNGKTGEQASTPDSSYSAWCQLYNDDVFHFGVDPMSDLTFYFSKGLATPPETLLTTITATGKEQASYSVENVASVSFSYTANGSSAYFNNGTTNWGWWGYGWIATITPANGYNITKCVFYDDQDRTATDSEAPFVVETTEGDKTPQVNGTPILAYTSKGITKIEVYGYVTPSVVSTVTLNTNGGIINAGDVTEYTEGTGATLPTDVTKNNYTFGGWYDNSELTGDAMEAISPSETGDKTYWAKWTMNGDQQIFVKLRDDATKTVNVDMTDTIAVVKQKASDLFECAYEKMFLIFAGKLLDDDAKTLEQCNIQKEATLHLIVGYFVTFESNGGSAVAGKPVSENATMVAPDEPTKAEHTFVGWYKEPALTNAWDFDNDTVTEDITLYAKWTENPNITELTFSGYNGDYDTNGHGAVVTGDTSNYTIRYSTDGVEYTLEQTPTYTVVSQHTIYYQVTRDGYKTLTGSVEIVIGKATPSYTVPTGLVATYGDTLSSISLPTGWAWSDSTASVGNAGTNTFAATFTPEDTANYNTVEQDLSVTVGKATPSYTVPTDLVATYGDTLSSISLPTGWAWADNTASVGNAGTNTFKANFTPADTANYNTVNNVDVTVTVVKADPTYTIPSGLTATYGYTLSSVTLPEGWTWTEPTTSVGTVGSHTFAATFTPDNTDNYNTVKEDLTVTVNANDKSALIAAIGSASEYYNSISLEHPDIAATLQNAIDVATSVKNDDNKTEAEISDAVTALNSALDQAKADENQAKASIVKARIDAIGTVGLTVNSKALIDLARESYDGLTAEQKALVSNYDVLTAAEVRYADLRAADEVNTLIDSIGDVTYSTESKGKIDAARAAYNALTPEQQALVPNYETLTAAEVSYTDLKVAKEAEDAINALPATDDITASDKAKVQAAQAKYDALTPAQKEMVSATVVAKLEAAGNMVAAQEVIASIEAIDASNPDSTKVAEARTAYNTLTADQKALVDNYAVLTAAENKLVENNNSEKQGLSGGAIAGIVIAFVVVLSAIGFLVFSYLKQRKNEKK